MLRYEEYKDSGAAWIGAIPSTWKVGRLKKHLKRTDARNPGKVQVLSLYRELGVIPKNSRDDNHNVTSEDTSKYKYVQPGDFVVNKMKAWQGSVAVSDHEGIVSPAYYVYKFLDDRFHKRYFHYLIRSCYKEEFMRLSAGIRIGQWDLSSEDLDCVPILLPSMNEQISIAKFLDERIAHIDTIITEAKASIEEYKAWKASIIYEAVTKGLDLNVEMKDSGIEWIGDIPIEWSIIPFTKGIESIVDYRGKTPEKVSEGVFLVTARNIKDGAINYDLAKEYVRTEEYDEIMHRGIPQIGDVLFTTEAPLGEVANVDRTDFALAQRVIKFRAKPDILDNYFLKYWMMSFGFQQNLFTFATGSTAKGIKASKLGQLKTILPPIDEQQQIVAYLDKKWAEINTLISEKEALVADLEAYKKSLIFEVVTGKRRVC